MKYERYINSANDSFFLFGPRGTGKSTWLHEKYPDALLVDLLREDVKVRLEANPERLVELVDGNPAANPIIIDEIQRVSALLPVVEYLKPQEFNRSKFVCSN